MPGPDNLFADLIPGAKAPPSAVYGAPPTPKTPTLPTGWEPDPDNPGGIRPISGGPDDPSSQGIFDDQTKDFYAQQVLTGAPLPSLGYGKEAVRAKQDIMNRVARMAGAQGMNGTDFAAQLAHYKAGTASLQKMQTMHDQISQAEQTALANGKQLIDLSNTLPGQGHGPIFNAITQTWERYNPYAAGHDQIAAFDAAYNTFVNEYAKVVSGSPSGAGVLSDSARREAMETLRKSTDPSQKRAAFEQMKKDMANRIDAINAVIQDGYKNITRRYDQYSVPQDPAQAQLPASWIKAHPDSLAAASANGGGNNDGGGGGNTPPGVSDLTPEQKQAYTAFLAANPKPSGDEIGAFLSKLTGKQVTNGDEIAKAIAQGAGVSTTVEDKTYQQKLKDRIAQEDKLGLNNSPAEVLARQGGTLNLSDEAAGVGNALSNVITAPFTGKFDPAGSYQFGRDEERMRIADARQQLGYGGTAIELVSGAAAAGPTAALDTLTGKAAAQAAGKAGAAGGALAGFGSGEGTDQSTAGAVGGALTGYAVGRYAPTVLDKVLPNRFRPPQGMAPDVAEAAKAEGVDIIRPMVDPSSISEYGALESNRYSQPTIRGGAARVRGQIEDRALALSGDGTPLETDAAGGVIQNAGRRFIQRSKGVADTLYNRARNIAGDQRFVPENAIAQVDSEIAQLQANPDTNAGEIRFLEGLKSDLSTPGGKTVEELRQLRTSLRGRVNEQNLGATQAEARAIRALDATQQDVSKNVPDAATAYRRADTYYRERQTHIDDIIRRITGGKVGANDYQVSGEQAFQRLKSMASPGGDGRRLAALMRDLDPGERQDIAATIAQGLGRRAPDEPFSTALFLSQARKLSPSARKTIFGPDGAKSIDNLRLLSRKLEEAEKDINRSRSATVLERQGIRTAARAFIAGISGVIGHAFTGNLEGMGAGLAVAGGAMGMQATGKVLSARAMVNPRVSRWLAEAADASTPAQAKEATRKLGVIISREPALAHELRPIYDFLENRLALPLAAEPDQSGKSDNEQQ